MPQIIPAIITVAVSGGAATVGAFILKTLAVAAGTYIVGRLTEKDIKNPETVAPERSITASSVAARWVVGRARVGGTIVYAGAHERDLVMVIALSQGECEAIESVWIDGEKVPMETGDIPVTFAPQGIIGVVPFTRNITGLRPPEGNEYRDRIEIFPSFFPTPTAVTGSANLAATGLIPRLVGDSWTAQHSLTGISYVVVRLNQNDYGRRTKNRFWDSIPQLSFLVQGLKFTNPALTTPTFTNNPADVWYWWLTERRGIPADEIDETEFLAARATCNTQILSNTRRKYTCNGWIDADDDAVSVEAALGLSMAGSVVEHMGMHVIRPGVDRPSTLTLTEDDIIAEPLVVPAPPQADRYNQITGRLAQDAGAGWLNRDLEPVTDEVNEDRDGELLPRDLGDIRFTTHRFRAKYLAAVLLRQAKDQTALDLRVRPGSTFQNVSLIPGDKVTVTLPAYGFEEKDFQVVRHEVQSDMSVSLRLLAWPSDLFGADYEEFDEVEPPTIVAQPVQQAQNVKFTPAVKVFNDGTSEVYIDATWDDVPELQVEVYATKGGDEVRQTVTGDSQTRLSPLDTGTWTVEVTSISTEGRRSEPVREEVELKTDLFPDPPAVNLVAVRQLGGSIHVELNPVIGRPDVTGFELRGRSKSLTSTDTLAEIKEDDWDTLTQLGTQFIPASAGSNIIVTFDIPESGIFRLAGRFVSRAGLYGAIGQVGGVVLVQPATSSFNSQFEPEFDGTKTGMRVLTEGDLTVLAPDETPTSAITDDEWNGAGGWPFGASSSTYRSDFVDLDGSKSIEATVNVSQYQPADSSLTLGTPTVKLISKLSETGNETETSITLGTPQSLTAAFLAVEVQVANAGLSEVSVAGRILSG